MSFQIYDERFLGEFGVIPLVYAMGAGAVAAGGIVSAWLSKDDWSVGEYNAYMNEMYQTILVWNDIGWKKGCFNDAGRRARWKIFMDAFGKHYGEHGKISGISYVSDSEEKPARYLMQQLAAWGEELNAACGANIPAAIPQPPGGSSDEDPSEPIDYLKWGVYLVGGVLALQVFSAIRGVAPR